MPFYKIEFKCKFLINFLKIKIDHVFYILDKLKLDTS